MYVFAIIESIYKISSFMSSKNKNNHQIEFLMYVDIVWNCKTYLLTLHIKIVFVSLFLVCVTKN